MLGFIIIFLDTLTFPDPSHCVMNIFDGSQTGWEWKFTKMASLELLIQYVKLTLKNVINNCIQVKNKERKQFKLAINYLIYDRTNTCTLKISFSPLYRLENTIGPKATRESKLMKKSCIWIFYQNKNNYRYKGSHIFRLYTKPFHLGNATTP